MANATCPIWGTPADETLRDIDNTYFNSPRAGGPYGISDMALALIKQADITPIHRARLTTRLHNQREAGKKTPFVSARFLRTELSSLRPLTTTERVEKALLYFNKRIRIGGRISVTPPTFITDLPDDLNLMILTESIDSKELVAFLEMLSEMEWLDERDSDTTSYNFTGDRQRLAPRSKSL